MELCFVPCRDAHITGKVIQFGHFDVTCILSILEQWMDNAIHLSYGSNIKCTYRFGIGLLCLWIGLRNLFICAAVVRPILQRSAPVRTQLGDFRKQNARLVFATILIEINIIKSHSNMMWLILEPGITCIIIPTESRCGMIANLRELLVHLAGGGECVNCTCDFSESTKLREQMRFCEQLRSKYYECSHWKDDDWKAIYFRWPLFRFVWVQWASESCWSSKFFSLFHVVAHNPKYIYIYIYHIHIANI